MKMNKKLKIIRSRLIKGSKVAQSALFTPTADQVRRNYPPKSPILRLKTHLMHYKNVLRVLQHVLREEIRAKTTPKTP